MKRVKAMIFKLNFNLKRSSFASLALLFLKALKVMLRDQDS
jgi:hypothetical protein